VKEKYFFQNFLILLATDDILDFILNISILVVS